MRGVRGLAESVDDKVLRALDEADACVGNFAAVREVCERFFGCRAFVSAGFVGFVGGCAFIAGSFVGGCCGCNGIVAWCWRDGCAALTDVPADYVQCAVFHGKRETE